MIDFKYYFEILIVIIIVEQLFANRLNNRVIRVIIIV